MKILLAPLFFVLDGLCPFDMPDFKAFVFISCTLFACVYAIEFISDRFAGGPQAPRSEK